MEKHEKIKHPEDPTKKNECPYCDNQWSLKDTRDTHVRVKHPDSDAVTPSCHCGSTFDTRGGLRQHQRARHEGSLQQRAECRFCDKDYLNTSNRDEYEKQKHIEISGPEITCLVCDEKFDTMKGLRYYEAQLHPNVPTEIQCYVCGKDFLSIDGRNRHERRQHYSAEPERENSTGSKERFNSSLILARYRTPNRVGKAVYTATIRQDILKRNGEYEGKMAHRDSCFCEHKKRRLTKTDFQKGARDAFQLSEISNQPKRAMHQSGYEALSVRHGMLSGDCPN